MDIGLDRLKAAYEFDVDAGLDRLKAAVDSNELDIAPSGPENSSNARRTEWAEIAVLIDTNGDLPTVAELDPYQLGAVPTRFGWAGHHGPDTDPYVPRSEVDARLSAALVESAMVVVIGPSLAGKTRSLFEAVRRELPSARVFVPNHAMLHTILQDPSCLMGDEAMVVWLDDLDRYLTGAQAFSTRTLTRLRTARSGRTVIVATLRPDPYMHRRGDLGALSTTAHALLDDAIQIHLESTATDPVEQLAAVTSYPDVSLSGRSGFKLGEALVDDSNLFGRSEDADQNAITLIDALAARSVQRSVAMFNVGNIYDKRGDQQRAEIWWHKSADAGYVAAMINLGELFRRSGHFQESEIWWHKAADAGSEAAMANLGDLLREAGRFEAAEMWYRRAVDAGYTSAMINLGDLLREAGRFGEAESWYISAYDTASRPPIGGYFKRALPGLVREQYSAVVGRRQPVMLFLMVDQSSSMSEVWPRLDQSKAKVASDIVNKALYNVALMCSRGGGRLYDYFNIGVFGYGAELGPILGDVSASNSIVSVNQLMMTARVEEHKAVVKWGAGDIMDVTKRPIWVEPVADGDTPMTEAFLSIESMIAAWCEQHPSSFPPIVVNITDGESTDGDPSAAAKRICLTGTDDGPTLLFNLNLSVKSDSRLVFPHASTGLPDRTSKLLFELSSELPETVLASAADVGYPVKAGARGFLFNSDLNAILNLLITGTRAVAQKAVAGLLSDRESLE
ncbi:sel1 repeat family protein [Nocardia sp. CA2R105]|uniref:tetratricopeptide repeat protein n=1 Tax=Nocardia coffeae TaxID=2873381 RepID=UPI001CA6D33B|nr:tetratricopeptide repeat protein [Nocardia coffeae]MBY8863886.1 sel1 repeat family protein [Nocardia coffeae]